MPSIRSVRAASRAPFARFSTELRRHRTATRLLVGALCLAVAAAASSGGAVQAGLGSYLPTPASILPVSVGIGVHSGTPVTLDFGEAVDPGQIESALSISPAQQYLTHWSSDHHSVQLSPVRLWLTDQRYVVTVGARHFTFTTQTAPRITDFQVGPVDSLPGNIRQLAKAERPSDTAADVSAHTAIQISFSAQMNPADVERAFVLSPAVPGVFSWRGTVLTYAPAERLSSDARYAVSISGAHDADGNPLGGDTSFSFTTRAGAQLVHVSPGIGATNVTDRQVVLWFSQPLRAAVSAAALTLTDLVTGAKLPGKNSWNSAATQLIFTPSRAFTSGHRFSVQLGAGALDADGNAVTANWTFSTPGQVVRAAPRVSGPVPATASGLVAYALKQVNAARASYGLAPLTIDPAISAVSSAHAWDMMRNNYFSHTSLDGRTYADRLRDGGIKFGYSGENICYYSGMPSTYSVLDWCHATFMAEPYPGYYNHKANILDVHFRRMGVGVAQVGSKVIVVWDFTD